MTEDASIVEILLARQPIFDRKKRLIAYELLSRSGSINLFMDKDGDVATTTLVSQIVDQLDLSELTASKPAFINFTPGLVQQGAYTELPSEEVVVELDGVEQVTDDLVTACKALVGKGYRLSIGEFAANEQLQRLLPLAHFVKIDVEQHDLAGCVATAKAGGDGKQFLIANKVETQEQFQVAHDLGVGGFQGFFFCKPEVIRRKELQSSKLVSLRIMEELSRPELEFDRLEEVIRIDPALTLRLLRRLNSAAFGLTSEITSIKHALTMLGEHLTKKWLSAMAVSDLCTDKPSELAIVAMNRAGYCERLARATGLEGREFELFLTGLLSVMDAMFDCPMSEVLAQIKVPERVKSALSGDSEELGNVLEISLAHEQGNWTALSKGAHTLGIDMSELSKAYHESTQWTSKLAG